MLGFGVGFGLGGFGSDGFAFALDVVTVAIEGSSGVTAEATVTTAVEAPSVQIPATSSLTVKASGISVTAKKPHGRVPLPAFVVAKPATTPTMRTVPQPTVHTYTISPRQRYPRRR